MADNYLITGYWGEPHVTAENDRGINAAMFGTGRFVLPVGEQFKAEYIGNNTVRMYDGKLMDNGAAAGIPVGEYVDLLIANAGQGMKRNDLIVFQYSKDASTLIESGVFTVIQGTETSGTASNPALTQEDLLSGEAAFDQMALWRVSVSGTTVAAPVKLFSVSKNIPGLEAWANGAFRPSNWTPSASDVGAVPTSRTVNGKALSSNITLSASDVGARPSTWTPSASDVGAASATPSVSSASSAYHTAYLAKIGKLVICTLVLKALSATIYSETITIPSGYRPSAAKTFTIYSDIGHWEANGSNVTNGGGTTVSVATGGKLTISSSYSFGTKEMLTTLCWATS